MNVSQTVYANRGRNLSYFQPKSPNSVYTKYKYTQMKPVRINDTWENVVFLYGISTVKVCVLVTKLNSKNVTDMCDIRFPD